MVLTATAVLPVPPPAQARDAHLTFERFSTAHGLSSPEVTRIHVDRAGFLWVATAYGLNRYDGTGFTIFQHEPDDSLSLAGSWVGLLHEDRDGALWLSHVTEGVTRFDPATGAARYFGHAPDRPTSFGAGRCSAITEDDAGGLWFAAGTDGVCRWNPAIGGFERFRAGIAGNEVLDLAPGPDGRLWLAACPAGLLRLDPVSGSVDTVTAPGGRHGAGVRAIVPGAAGRTWVLDGDGRLFGAEADGDSIRLRPIAPRGVAPGGIRFVRESPSVPGRLYLALERGDVAVYAAAPGRWTFLPLLSDSTRGRPGIEVLLEGEDGTLWAGTTAGLYLREPGGEAFEHLPAFSRLSGIDFTTPHVTDIREDAAGLLWIGTRGVGLLKLNPGQKRFHHDFFAPRFLGEPDALAVSGIYRDPRGIVWTGTVASGLHRYDPGTGEHRTYRHDAGDATTLPGNEITALRLSPATGALWLGTRHGVALFDRDSGRVRRFPLGPPRGPGSTGVVVTALDEDTSGALWIGTAGSGVVRLDPATGRIVHFPARPDSTEGLADGSIQAILADPSGDVWISAIPAGLHRFRRDRGEIERHTHAVDPRLPRSIQCLYRDRAGALWLGGYSDGLVRYDPAAGMVRRWSRSSGLPSNRVLSVLEDDTGRIWMGTDRGLASLDPRTGSVRVFGPAHGVQDRLFLVNSAFRTPEGELIFGGIDGLNTFHPDSLRLNGHIPPIAVTAVRIDGRAVPGRTGSTAEIRLSPRDRVLSVDFVALDYMEPERNRYACRLEGVDREWIDNGTRRTLSYANLAPGRYTLRIRGANNDGTWNESGIALPVVVEPPFWKTRTFAGSALALLAGSVLIVHRRRMADERHRALEIERIRQAEQERVRRQAARDVHDELGHLVTRITLYGEVVRRRLPPGDSVLDGYLDRIVVTSQRLSQGMGDFIWMLDPGNGTLHEVAIRLKDFGDHLFIGSGIDFLSPGLADGLERWDLPLPWRRHLTLLAKEAMHNALKHSRAATVSLSIAITDSAVDLEVRDDGRGFDPEAPESGRGLHNMRTRATELGGRLAIVTAPGRGTSVRFTAPLPGGGTR